ncbi:MAG: hypothetical protein NC412_09880 [Roseburia sp.]|nr:hypothetical protein [Roseburia sp.]
MEVKEIIRVMDDGTQDKVEHGAVIEISGDTLNIECLNIMPVDVVRIAIGMLKAVYEFEMDDLLKEMYGYYSEGRVDNGGAEKR